jgi:hypothetical protein
VQRPQVVLQRPFILALHLAAFLGYGWKPGLDPREEQCDAAFLVSTAAACLACCWLLQLHHCCPRSSRTPLPLLCEAPQTLLAVMLTHALLHALV